jgi:hypothetical protein
MIALKPMIVREDNKKDQKPMALAQLPILIKYSRALSSRNNPSIQTRQVKMPWYNWFR